MDAPTVVNEIRDTDHNVTYRIVAYRRMRREEIVHTVRLHLAQPKMRRRKTRERKAVVIIQTIHGASSGL